MSHDVYCIIKRKMHSACNLVTHPSTKLVATDETFASIYSSILYHLIMFLAFDEKFGACYEILILVTT